jgi:hypothetical protein
MNVGWFDGEQGWYICTDAGSARLAACNRATFAPSLNGLLNTTAAPPVYVVANPHFRAVQGLVFSTAPGNPSPPYSGIWTVVYVFWRHGAKRVVLTSATQVDERLSSGDLTSAIPNAVVDCPIIALGDLGNPAYSIPQAIKINSSTRKVTLPTWNTYCRSPWARTACVQRIIIPDVASDFFAATIGANFAPGLEGASLPESATTFLLDPFQTDSEGNPLPLPSKQFLVRASCPGWLTACCLEWSYNPVEFVQVLDRVIPPLPPNMVFKSASQITSQIGVTLIPVGTDYMNGPVISGRMW